jgi:hypothetical protein
MNIKSTAVIKIQHESKGIRWCSRMRFADNTELFAGADNEHGKSAAETAHTTYCAGIEMDTLPHAYHPITRERIEHWGELPQGWRVMP